MSDELNMFDEQYTYVRPEPPKEHILRGIFGAIGGSLIGVVAMLLLGRIGFVASFAGLLMAKFALKGYQRTAGAISKRGITISCIVMVLMTLLAEYLNWSITI